jgi:hypothetical protein
VLGEVLSIWQKTLYLRIPCEEQRGNKLRKKNLHENESASLVPVRGVGLEYLGKKGCRTQ